MGGWGGGGGGGEEIERGRGGRGERDRERQTERQRERDRDRQEGLTDRQTDKSAKSLFANRITLSLNSTGDNDDDRMRRRE